MIEQDFFNKDEKPEEINLIKFSLRNYMEKFRIKSIKELADLFEEAGSTINYWIGGSDGTNETRVPQPKKAEKIMILLKKSPEEIRQERDKKFELVNDTVSLTKKLIPLMILLANRSKKERVEYRQRLGHEFEKFLNLVRALSSETARTTVLNEKLIELEEGD